jgi:hypothetical protein
LKTRTFSGQLPVIITEEEQILPPADSDKGKRNVHSKSVVWIGLDPARGISFFDSTTSVPPEVQILWGEDCSSQPPVFVRAIDSAVFGPMKAIEETERILGERGIKLLDIPRLILLAANTLITDSNSLPDLKAQSVLYGTRRDQLPFSRLLQAVYTESMRVSRPFEDIALGLVQQATRSQKVITGPPDPWRNMAPDKFKGLTMV